MSESTENTAPAGENTETNVAVEFHAPSSQEDLNRIIEARLDRERKKFADYDEVKAKAAKLDEVEEANKTEAQKVAERLESAEKRANELEGKYLRAEVAAAKGVPLDLLTGSSREGLEASADALIAFRGEQKQSPSSSALGRVNGQTVKGTTADQFASFISDQLS